MSDSNNPGQPVQLEMGIMMIVDNGSQAYDPARRRQIRAKRHVKPTHDKIPCGHLPTDGQYIQIPLSIKAFLQVSDCALCKAYLEGLAAVRVVVRDKAETFTPTSNTGVNY